MPDTPKPDDFVTFARVLADELRLIRQRRRGAWGGTPAGGGDDAAPLPADDADLAAWRKAALDEGVVGLALSGGGIRSGTFGLGFLQGLSRLGLLRAVDYLSTVSGGGYVGGWLTAWLHREGLARGDAALANVEKQLDPDRKNQAEAVRTVETPDGEMPLDALLDPGRIPPKPAVLDDEPEPVYHLRAYSNYLAPRPGVLSADTWTLFAIYARNTLVNLLILVPAVLAAVLFGHLVAWRFAQGHEEVWGPALVFAVTTLLAVASIALRLTYLRLAEAERPGAAAPVGSAAPESRWQTFEATRAGFVGLIVAPTVVAAATAVWLLTAAPADPGGPLRYPLYHHANDLLGRVCRLLGIPDDESSWAKFVVGGVAVAAVAGVTGLLFHARAGGRTRWLAFSSPIVLGGVAGGLIWAVLEFVVWPLGGRPVAVATVGPPLVVLALSLAGFVESAVFSRALSEFEREWRSRLAAALAMVAAAWLILFGAVFFLPPAVVWVAGVTKLGDSATWVAIGGWAATTVGGLFAAQSQRTGATGGRRPSPVLELVAKVAPVVFLVGLLGLLAVLAAALVGVSADGTRMYAGGEGASLTRLWWILGCGVGCFLFSIGLSAVTDVNVFSMHALYANRLVRCYLGASRRKVFATDDPDRGRLRQRSGRWEWKPGVGGAPAGVGRPARSEHPVTGFDPHDDFALAALVTGFDAAGHMTPRVHPGPYHLINTALNLVAGDELAVQDRRAAAFVLSPLYCGGEDTGFARTPVPVRDGDKTNLTLGRAMTISGAAADPNMSTHGSAAVTALMTAFNVRLGWWMENPGRPAAGKPWAARPPAGGVLPQLTREFFGLTDEKGASVHLSDGGHFDNTGVYELVRRRCRYVVQVDAAQDGDDLYEDLGKLIRLVRADFGIRIEIDTGSVRKGPDGLSRWHVAVGKIRYDDVDANALPGTLVFVRPTRTGDEPADVRQYAATHPEYPHTPTGDQFFDNDQFEAYRVLGEHAAVSVFEDAARAGRGWPPAPGAGATDLKRAVRGLFAGVHNRWFPPPPGIDVGYQAAGSECAALMAQLRQDDRLAGFVQALYPELALAGAGTPAPPELLVTNQVLDVMERAWLGIHLATHYSHPMHRGWMNAFRRWSTSDTFRRAWPVLRGEYGKDFVRFCERALNLPAIRALPEPVDPVAHEARVDQLDEELLREWGGLLGRVNQAKAETAVALQTAAALHVAPPAAPRAVPSPALQLAPAPEFERLSRAGLRFLRGVANTVGGRRELEEEARRTAGSPALMAEAPQAWLLYLAEPQPDGTDRPIDHLRDYPIGLLAVTPLADLPDAPGVPNYEVVFWVRPAYRSLGLGRSAIEHARSSTGAPVGQLYLRVRAAIRALHPDAPVIHLWAHYPAGGSTGGEKPQRDLWLNFVHDYDFRRVRTAADWPWVSVRYTERKSASG